MFVVATAYPLLLMLLVLIVGLALICGVVGGILYGLHKLEAYLRRPRRDQGPRGFPLDPPPRRRG